MELPADPKNLVYGIYNKMGQDLTKIKAESNPAYWALRDDEDADLFSRETAFDMINYNEV